MQREAELTGQLAEVYDMYQREQAANKKSKHDKHQLKD